MFRFQKWRKIEKQAHRRYQAAVASPAWHEQAIEEAALRNFPPHYKPVWDAVQHLQYVHLVF